MRLSLKHWVGGRWGGKCMWWLSPSCCTHKVCVVSGRGLGAHRALALPHCSKTCPHLSPALMQNIIPSWLPSDLLLLRQLE